MLDIAFNSSASMTYLHHYTTTAVGDGDTFLILKYHTPHRFS